MEHLTAGRSSPRQGLGFFGNSLVAGISKLLVYPATLKPPGRVCVYRASEFVIIKLSDVPIASNNFSAIFCGHCNCIIYSGPVVYPV